MTTDAPPSYRYLDNAASAPLDPRALAAMLPWLATAQTAAHGFANPASLHGPGQGARTAVQNALAQIAHCLGARPDEITLTSGATEANNWAIRGLAETLSASGRPRHLVTTAIEHPSVREPVRWLERAGWRVTYAPVDREGFVHPDLLAQAMGDDTALVSIIHGHNEIGTVQPLDELIEVAHRHGALFHADAAQTVGKLPLNVARLPVDYLTFSAHKCYGPKGVGGLFARHDAPAPAPLLLGGGQQQGRRSGVENPALAVGFATALHYACEEAPAESRRLRTLGRRLLERLRIELQESRFRLILNGPEDFHRRLPGNAHFSLLCEGHAPLEGEALALQLDLRGIGVSSGSACHSGSLTPSASVLALGKTQAEATATLRVSLGRENDDSDVEALIAALPAVLRRVVPAGRL
ncbi:MAG: cysteine desulfurase [Vampirovibrionales bacterium]|nr:cysteine desulfurase [Vampirovibrionales bacterium]